MVLCLLRAYVSWNSRSMGLKILWDSWKGMGKPEALVAGTALSSLLGALCAQPGVRCLQRLDLRVDLPPERAAPLGELRLAEELQPALPIEQVACDGTQLCWSLACFCHLSRWPGRSS